MIHRLAPVYASVVHLALHLALAVFLDSARLALTLPQLRRSVQIVSYDLWILAPQVTWRHLGSSSYDCFTPPTPTSRTTILRAGRPLARELHATFPAVSTYVPRSSTLTILAILSNHCTSSTQTRRCYLFNSRSGPAVNISYLYCQASAHIDPRAMDLVRRSRRRTHLRRHVGCNVPQHGPYPDSARWFSEGCTTRRL